MKKKEISVFLNEDHQGHLEHSAEELRRHADRDNALTVQERKDYFYGITTVFPIMLLSHYYGEMLEGNVDEYMNKFASAAEEKYASQMKTMLKTVYDEPGNDSLWLAAISGYLATYPYELLREFAFQFLTEEQQSRMAGFIQTERADKLPELERLLASCRGDREKRVRTVVYLGGDFPFELLERFHREVFDEKS